MLANASTTLDSGIAINRTCDTIMPSTLWAREFSPGPAYGVNFFGKDSVVPEFSRHGSPQFWETSPNISLRLSLRMEFSSPKNVMSNFSPSGPTVPPMAPSVGGGMAEFPDVAEFLSLGDKFSDSCKFSDSLGQDCQIIFLCNLEISLDVQDADLIGEDATSPPERTHSSGAKKIENLIPALTTIPRPGIVKRFPK
jgi:hypothetical protein